MTSQILFNAYFNKMFACIVKANPEVEQLARKFVLALIREYKEIWTDAFVYKSREILLMFSNDLDSNIPPLRAIEAVTNEIAELKNKMNMKTICSVMTRVFIRERNSERRFVIDTINAKDFGKALTLGYNWITEVTAEI